MPRRPRIEVEGGLYHILTRGNNRRRIFNAPADYEKFLLLLARQKRRRPFFLYGYCLMTNHVHFLIERQTDSIGGIMQGLLTAYSQYYNRRYRRVGHLLQGRYKAILCQSERYLAELVRYIHLNPVRAKMVSRPEQYAFSGHRAYLGLTVSSILNIDPVLRHFGGRKKKAREAYRQFVEAGMKRGNREDFCPADQGDILGTEEFVDATIHRLGEASGVRVGGRQNGPEFRAEALLTSVERVCGVSRTEFCGQGKRNSAVTARELFIFVGSRSGASSKLLAEVTGMSRSAISRRHDAVCLKLANDREMVEVAERIRQNYSRT